MEPDPTLFPSPAELRERAYSPSSCIGGNYRPYIEAYAHRSAQAHAQALATGARWIEARYGALPAQRLDLCLPPRAMPSDPCPLLVFFHGGYWQELSASASWFAAARCAEHGIAFAAVDYTLAPQARLGAIVDECRAAWRWLVTHGAAHGIDAARAVVAGSSAGAHLAAMVAATPRRPGQDGPSPRGSVLVSGIYDLRPLVGTSINAALGLDDGEALQHSPMFVPLAGIGPAVLCWGEIETDAFKRQSQRFAAALRSAGVHTVAHEIAQRNHFDVILDLLEPGTWLGETTTGLLLR